MEWLHAGNHPEFAESRNVGGGDGFNVFDARAVIALVVPRFGIFIGIQRRPNAVVANRMREKLQAALVELRNRGLVTRRLLCALKIHAAKTKGAVDKMDVAIYKTREYKFSAGVDHSCAHAAHLLDYGVVTDSYNLAAMNGNGLGPRLYWVFRVNAAVHDDDVRRFNHPSLRARYRGSAEQECERLTNGAKRLIFHPYLPL